jgi:hypothetical protein
MLSSGISATGRTNQSALNSIFFLTFYSGRLGTGEMLKPIEPNRVDNAEKEAKPP